MSGIPEICCPTPHPLTSTLPPTTTPTHTPHLISCLLSLVSRLPSPISHLPSPVSRLVSSPVSGGRWPLGGEGLCWPPARVDDDHQEESGEFHRRQNGWKMTAGWGGVRLAASRGGGWPLGGEGKVWQRAGWVEDYCWAVMGIQDDQNCYFSMHTEDTLYNNNLVKFKPTEALSWKDKTEIKYYIFKTKKYCCAVVLHYCHSIINKIKNSVRMYILWNLSNWNPAQ